MNVLSLFDGQSCGQVALNHLGIKYENYFASEVDKFAIQVTQKNWPNTIQIGDVRNVKASDLPRIDLLLGGSPCFGAGTKVLTSEGYRPIENVCVGDLVLTHKGRFMPVVAVGGSIKPTVELSAQGFKKTITTAEHPYYMRRMKRFGHYGKRMFSDATWTPVSELKKDDFLAIPIIGMEANDLNLTNEECWILGRYIADGHIRHERRSGRKNSFHYQLILSIGASKKNDVSKIVEHHYSLYPHTKSTLRCVFSSKRLVDLVIDLNIGRSSVEKNIPPQLLMLPIEKLRILLDGYFSGDGSIRNNEIRATSVSETLIMSLNLAIAKVYKTNSSFEFTKRPEKCTIEGRVVNQKHSYSLSFRKEETLQRNSITIENCVWNRFRAINETGRIELVYNIEVAEDNSYTANNAIVHNCQGFSNAGKGLNFEDPRSKLFFEYVRILNEIRQANPDVKFLLENVMMKKEWQRIISTFLGVEPICINAARVSAQNRERLYWTNIHCAEPDLWGNVYCMIPQPADKGVLLTDILEQEVDKKYLLSEKAMARVSRKTSFHPKYDPDKTGCITPKNNSPELSLSSGTTLIGVVSDNGVIRNINKSHTIHANYGNGVDDNRQHTFVQVGVVSNNGEIRNVDKSTCVDANSFKGIDNHAQRTFVKMYPDGRIKSIQNKASTFTAGANSAGEHSDMDVLFIEQRGRGYNKGGRHTKKSPTVTSNRWEQNHTVGQYRRLTPTEVERLFTLPDGYTAGVSDSQRYKMLGNGWVVDVICHILSYLRQ